MKKSVLLELCEPVLSTYHYEGAGAAIISANPSIRNWYINQAVELSCEKRFMNGYTTPKAKIVQSTLYESIHLERYDFHMEHLKGAIHTVIRTLLDQGFFIFFWGVDDYYIPGKTWYKKRHFSHDGLICGYDQNDRTYTIYAYDENWKYTTFRIPQKSFEQGRRAMFRKDHYGMLHALKPRPEKVELDFKEICKRLHEHLASSFENHPPNGEGVAYGVIVHQYLAMYLDKLADNSIPYERMDWRVFRVLWEHKRLMLERIKALEDHFSWGSDFSSQYSAVVKVADHIRMVYVSYHRKRRDSLLTAIKEKLAYINEQEIAILTAVHDKLKEEIEK